MSELRDRRGDYGFDAPAQLLPVLGIGVGLGGAAVWLRSRRVLAAIASAFSFAFLSTFALYLHTTRRGKFEIWAELLHEQQLRGDEHVLDVGCGRGAVLATAAKLVPRGRATGLDLWTGTSRAMGQMRPAATWKPRA